MFESLALWVVKPGVANVWLILCFVVFIVPMVWLASWYHNNIDQTDGGKELMDKQAEVGAHKFNPKLLEGLEMVRDIEDGRYGSHVKSMQRRAYLVAFIWLIACTTMFGLAIWGAELKKVADGLG